MSNGFVTIIPPRGKEPSVMQLPGRQVFPNPDGSYTIPASFSAALLRDGWQLVPQQ